MLRTCKRCGELFIAKFSSEKVHSGRCPKNKRNRKPIRIVQQKKDQQGKVRKAKTDWSAKDNARRDAHYRAKYGISLEQYNEMLIRQDSRCAICGAITKLHVDHDHISGKIRGLLCVACNNALGQFRDSTGALRAAIDYIERE